LLIIDYLNSSKSPTCLNLSSQLLATKTIDDEEEIKDDISIYWNIFIFTFRKTASVGGIDSNMSPAMNGLV
jgi:hypothetical protein